jgi:hypothetical protein
MATTLFRLSEECLRLLSGGNIQAAKNISYNELKISICQVLNQLLKIEHLSVNEKMQEKIPNGTVIGTYDGIAVTAAGTGRSKASLPIKPIKLPRNMGIWSVYLTDDKENEFIPLQMGQFNLAKSQPLLNDLFGQVAYENKGMELWFTKDLTLLYPNKTISCELAVMDMSLYDDYTPIPILPEMEWQIKQEVVKLYGMEGISDLLVDSSNKQQQNVPVPQQKQTS